MTALEGQPVGTETTTSQEKKTKIPGGGRQRRTGRQTETARLRDPGQRGQAGGDLTEHGAHMAAAASQVPTFQSSTTPAIHTDATGVCVCGEKPSRNLNIPVSPALPTDSGLFPDGFGERRRDVSCAAAALMGRCCTKS